MLHSSVDKGIDDEEAYETNSLKQVDRREFQYVVERSETNNKEANITHKHWK